MVTSVLVVFRYAIDHRAPSASAIGAADFCEDLIAISFLQDELENDPQSLVFVRQVVGGGHFVDPGKLIGMKMKIGTVVHVASESDGEDRLHEPQGGGGGGTEADRSNSIVTFLSVPSRIRPYDKYRPGTSSMVHTLVAAVATISAVWLSA